MKKIILVFITSISLTMSAMLSATELPTITYESMSLSIKLSNDGTGVIQNVVCAKCNYRMVKITKASKAYVNGKQVNILRAKGRSGKMAGVIFSPVTREVIKITWAE